MTFEVTEQNQSALLPIFKPWEEPTLHRLPNPKKGEAAVVQPGRRPSKVPMVRAIRAEVDRWRRGGYAGVSGTSRTLLNYWFNTEHLLQPPDGPPVPFRYHWAQREAIETVVYLYELRRVRNVAELLFEFGDQSTQLLALGIPPEGDRWPRYCSKIATGVGKTKIMSLAVVWSYYHSLYEPGSDLARHFVLIAPNLTVYERLKDDFENNAIFYQDPLLPEEWRADFQMQVVLQDEPGGSSSQGAVYLSNIHRLYQKRDGDAAGSNSILGPDVKKAQALDTGVALRQRIASHPTIMVLNDEAHHLHDPDLAWNQAIENLHDQSLGRGNRGLCLQLDFTATPKHDDGSLFRHIMCDFPLGEAVDAGIVKVPVLGESDELTETGDRRAPAHERFGMHLKLGYQRYEMTYEELQRVRKPILFVMTEDAEAANEVADYLDSDAFPLLKGRVLNIHTRLKGRIKTVSRGGRTFQEYVESETAMKPEDLRALREMSRELDKKESKFRCVVSVMMLREGWDVRNVTTISPLRPYSAKSGILPEQTLGRGLRRMFPLGDAPEMITVVHHPAFRKLYEEELAQEGLDIAVLPIQKSLRQTVTIFVDREHKPVEDLDIVIPHVSDAIETTAELDGLTFEEVRKYYLSEFDPLPVGKKKEGPILYRERHMFTDEIVARMQLDAGLLSNAWSASGYFAQMLGRACHISNPHKTLTPLIEEFLSKVLFERPVDLYSGEVDHRMREVDVLEHVRATFTPLILYHTVHKTERKRISRGEPLSGWNPFQASSTKRQPAVPAERTLFNLVACDNDFEQAFADFCDYAGDIAAFAKNAGPQKLMIDYLKPDGHRAFYLPDFFVRATDGTHYLCELKGREDNLVPLKAQAAIEWCKVSSKGATKWQYLYVPYALFQKSAAATVEELARSCAPSLKTLVQEARTGQLALALDEATVQSETENLVAGVYLRAGVESVPGEVDATLRQSITLLDHAVRSGMPDFGFAFQPLLQPLDEYAIRLLERRLSPLMPDNAPDRVEYFSPYLGSLGRREQSQLEKNGRYLKDNLVEGRSIQRLGTLLFCLNYAADGGWGASGVWRDVEKVFGDKEMGQLYADLEKINNFRNHHVAHVETRLTDKDVAWAAMALWTRCLSRMARAAAS